MPRSVLVYLADITGACEAIARFLAGVDNTAYRETELLHSVDILGTDVRRHNDDGIAEVHTATLGVREPTVVKNLK